MPDSVTGADFRDADLRAAVERLMAFRANTLRDLRLSYDDHLHHPYSSAGGNARHTLALMQNPLWHAVEEALR